MKTVLNRARRPLRIHLARGKVLHLGPGKEGQISDHDRDSVGVQKLVEAGELEVLDEGSRGGGGHGKNAAVHEDTHGHHPETSGRGRGDR